MTPTFFLLAATVFLAAFSAGFFAKLWREIPSGQVESPLGRPDAVAAGGLSVWFLWMVAESSSGPQVVTPSAILSSGVIYSGLVGLIAFFLTVRRISLDAVFGLRWERWRKDLPMVGLAALAVLPLVGLSQWAASLVFDAEAQAQPLLDYWMKETSFANRSLVVVMAVVVAPFAEEAIFRGYLFRVASRYTGVKWAILATSVLFAAIHAHLPAFPGLFVLAIALTLVYAKTGSLWAPILIHSAFNALTLVATILWPQLV